MSGSPNAGSPRRIAGLTPWAADGVIAAATAAVAIAAVPLSDEPTARPADGWAYALLVLAAAPLAVRRWWPPAALLATSLVTLGYFSMGYSGGPPTTVLLVALYSAAAAGHRWWALALTAVFAGGGLAFRALIEQEPVVGVLLNAALFVLVALLGEVVYSRRALRAEVGARLRQAAAEQEREAQRRVVDERMRIARELHDVMAHTVATMNVQAGVAADVLRDSPEDASDALRAIRSAAREAMSELRATVSVLREGQDRGLRPPAPGLGQLRELLQLPERSGVQVTLRVLGDQQELPAAVEMTAFRIVQEALTNVIRHAGAAHAWVTIRHEDSAVTVVVADDGRGPGTTPGGGYGLLGIRERAEALGGSVRAGPGPVAGFRVEARLPTGKAAR